MAERPSMFGQELRAARKRRGLSADACAKLGEISKSAVTQAERDGSPSLRILQGICKALQITVVVAPDETFVEPDR